MTEKLKKSRDRCNQTGGKQAVDLFISINKEGTLFLTKRIPKVSFTSLANPREVIVLILCTCNSSTSSPSTRFIWSPVGEVQLPLRFLPQEFTVSVSSCQPDPEPLVLPIVSKCFLGHLLNRFLLAFLLHLDQPTSLPFASLSCHSVVLSFPLFVQFCSDYLEAVDGGEDPRR